MDYFFKYQWNNIYQLKFIQLFDIYLKNEEMHKDLTDFIFGQYKLHETLINYFKSDSEKQKCKFEFKSGNKIPNGINSNAIHLIYKLQVFGGLITFSSEEQTNLKIQNLGEFEFLKDEYSSNIINIINISSNIGKILKESKEWTELLNKTVIPLIKKYEGKLVKEEAKEKNEKDVFTNNYSIDSLLKFINKDKKKSRIPMSLSLNDSNLNKIMKKIVIKDSLINNNKRKGQDIIDKEKDEEMNNNENNNNSLDNNFNDNNFWEVKNVISDELKKQVDRKTNIIFNYNPVTLEQENKEEISEEDELLSLAMDLERKENIEKNKQGMLMNVNPHKIGVFNLKEKVKKMKIGFLNNMPINNYKIKYNILNQNEEESDEKKQNKEEIEEDILIKKEEEEKEEDIKESNVIKEDNEKEKNEEFNDVNYWQNKPGSYLTGKELEDCLNDL
jgi:hypothetical protein